MITADFYIGWDLGRRRSAKQNILARGFQKIVVNLQRRNSLVAFTAADRRRVRAFTGTGYAVQAANVGIDEGNDVRAVEHADAVGDFLALGRMDPIAIENNVIAVLGSHNAADVDIGRSCPLNAYESDVVANRKSGRPPHH
jgi:hypothetical protein